jgi:hypothetical protein
MILSIPFYGIISAEEARFTEEVAKILELGKPGLNASLTFGLPNGLEPLTCFGRDLI